MKIDRLEETKLSRVEALPIQGLLKGLIARATHQTGCLVLRAIFPFSFGSVSPLTFAYELGLR